MRGGGWLRGEGGYSMSSRTMVITCNVNGLNSGEKKDKLITELWLRHTDIAIITVSRLNEAGVSIMKQYNDYDCLSTVKETEEDGQIKTLRGVLIMWKKKNGRSLQK